MARRTRRTQSAKTITPAVRINPTHRVSAPTHAMSAEVEGQAHAEAVLGILLTNEPGHDWAITTI